MNELATIKTILLYFQVHQPLRLHHFHYREPDESPHYFNHDLNKAIACRIAQHCYLPVNCMLLEMIQQHAEVRICFSISCVALDQFIHYCPEVIESFQQLADTGCVEFLAETNYHSLSSLVSRGEFEDQLLEHADKIGALFGFHPAVVRNTQLIYNDEIGQQVAGLGFRGIITEGMEGSDIRNPYELYSHHQEELAIFLRANALSDAIGFLFHHTENRVTASSVIERLKSIPGYVVVMGLMLETFGEHYSHECGIIDFLRDLLFGIVKDSQLQLSTPSTVLEKSKGTPLTIGQTVSWTDASKDLSAYFDNEYQREVFGELKALESLVKKSGSMELLET